MKNLSSTDQHRAWWYISRLIKFRLWLYLSLNFLAILIFTVAPQITGFIIKRFFDSLEVNSQDTITFWSLIGILLLTAIVRALAIFSDVIARTSFRFATGTLLRKNLFQSILNHPNFQLLLTSSGEAINRFREDIDVCVSFLAHLPILLGRGLFAIVAIIVMLQVNIGFTLIVFLPLIFIIIVAQLAMANIGKYRRASREATEDVTNFISEIFNTVQAIQVADAVSSIVERFRQLNEIRCKRSLKDRLFSELLNSIFRNAINLGTGIILIVAAQEVIRGGFTVGDFALFIYYVGFVIGFIGLIGMSLGGYKQVDVSFDRLTSLLQNAQSDIIVEHSPIYIRPGRLPEVPYYSKTPTHHLQKLEVSKLTYRHTNSRQGIEDINLCIERGSFNVITGRIGSGKSTFLQVLLGLLPKEAGDIHWNGQLVENPATFFVPPRVGYVSQDPHLFSESLKDNILLGLPEDKIDLQFAIRTAVMEEMLTKLEEGINTVIGPRGVKLSGGQRQRTAAARVFVREPELLIFDDLSSALDVETEHLLWNRVCEMIDQTCLAVSHRRSALQRADQVIVLKEGKVEAVGKLETLLKTSEEMQVIWQSNLENTPDSIPGR